MGGDDSKPAPPRTKVARTAKDRTTHNTLKIPTFAIVVLDTPVEDGDTFVLESSAGSSQKHGHAEAITIDATHVGIRFDNLRSTATYSLVQQRASGARQVLFQKTGAAVMTRSGETGPLHREKVIYTVSPHLDDSKYDADLKAVQIDYTQVEVEEPTID